MEELTRETIRKVVKNELDPVTKLLEDLVKANGDTKAIHLANEQKFLNVQRMLEMKDRQMEKISNTVFTLTTQVIPGIEKAVAQNTFSFSFFLKLFFGIIIPFATAMLGTLYMLQKEQVEIIESAIKASIGS